MLEDQAIPHAVTLDHQIRAGPRQAIEFIPQLIIYLWMVACWEIPKMSRQELTEAYEDSFIWMHF